MSGSGRGRENRRVKRIRLSEPLKVIIGSIGADVRYNLMTIDVSDTGFFLAHDSPGRFPFSPSSILEVWMDLGGGGENTIFFNGKMARVVYPKDPLAQEMGPGIAIRIAQITRESEARLKEFVEQKSKGKDPNDKGVA
jgi:hypothetical protein